MSKAFAKVVTANALRSGRVVWLSESDGWTQDVLNAALFTDAEAAENALARAAANTAEVVGCYLADMRATESGPEPTHFREAFRRDGPSAAARIPTIGA